MHYYYATNGLITELGDWTDEVLSLPSDIADLVKVIQGLMIHIYWAGRYELSLSPQRMEEVQFRKVAPMLQRIIELDARPLTEARSLEKRLVGNCRDFSTLVCSFLRAQGIPTRARCGFGTYFTPGKGVGRLPGSRPDS